MLDARLPLNHHATARPIASNTQRNITNEQKPSVDRRSLPKIQSNGQSPNTDVRKSGRSQSKRGPLLQPFFPLRFLSSFGGSRAGLPLCTPLLPCSVRTLHGRPRSCSSLSVV